MTITATYSPEDNKLRLYPSERLDQETFQRVKEAGYKWAPRQELFVAPMWTPGREDLAIELAGEIEPEEMTVAERAQAKADRLEDIAERREQQATAYERAAQELAKAFEWGQPILVGHHSERKARKTQEKLHSASDKAVQASRAVGYWLYRAESVERHANRKNDPRVRARRIKTLLADLRGYQRRINDAHRSLATWQKMTTPEQIFNFLGYSELAHAPYGTWAEVRDGKKDAQEARSECMKRCENIINSPRLSRWIMHTLHRISYEREMQGQTPRFQGDITPAILQIFAREQGAEKPKAEKVDTELFTLSTKAPLPVHLGDGSELELSADEWRDLMQECGHVPADKAPAKPPILNFKAPSGQLSYICPHRRELVFVPQVEMTKAEYSKIHSEQRGTRLSDCGQFRFRIAPNPSGTGPRYTWGWAAILISDQKHHETPDALKDFSDATQQELFG
jgi:hypothetical protein